MEKTGQSVEEHLAGVSPRKRRADAERLLPLFTRVTGQPAEMWGTVIGFGQYHYRYASGHEGDAPAAGFAPRRAATTIYLYDGVDAHRERLERLGPHTTGVGCLYVKDLDAVDLAVLEEIVAASCAALGDAPWPVRDHARRTGPGGTPTAAR
ncbi:DUF1801 domain-containing protein [Kocuria flava]|uniref:DUF1801 domain-containing protein n=1 Tax=Kocuria flava TaxID=446860 RepID=UPI000DD46537|nr:DUF1801 domain-containing protein [Kocuria flava]MCJ8503456.1 DUF1801 domain-containing protein [Kocuria flava]